MEFIYEQNTPNNLNLTGDNYKYLFRVRRVKNDEPIFIRNFEDEYLYKYEIVNVDKKEANLRLVEKTVLEVKAKRDFHLGWCVIDTKNIEKILPSLNEIGVNKISFIYCDRSQKNFKLNLERLQKILISSSTQCGRSNLMEIEILNSLDEFKEKYREFVAFDFGGEVSGEFHQRAVVGCEGGFSEREREMFEKKISFDTPLILKSESAVMAVASKMLL
jgi:16S rRNA (uracil1498-N3)-methyltransferase